ncbi:MAG: CPBP family intramembrane metalloprotease [Prevotella sp.]|nr:CPBP family intramembrane metalloprotease [Prevotella sp.]
MKDSLFYSVMFLCIQFFSSALVTVSIKFLAPQLASSPYVQLATIALFALVTIIVFIRLHWATPTRQYLMSHPWLTIIWAVIASFGCTIPSMAFQELMPELPNYVEEQLAAVMNAHGGYFMTCLLVPLTEELVFRGAALRALLKWRPDQHWRMIAVSALLFSAAHLNPAQMPHAFLVGLLLGWMYYRTRSIVPGVAFHCANNTIAYILFKLYPDPNIKLVDVFGSQQSVLLAVLFSLLIFLPAVYQLNLWMKKTEA